MTAIHTVLTEEHRRHKALMERLEETQGASELRQELMGELAPELVAHANAEEQVLYAELMSLPESQETAQHSVAEHKQINDLLDELSDRDMESGAWLLKFRELKHKVEHHMDEEEEDVFPLTMKLLSEAKRRSMAEDFHDRKRAEKRS